MSFSTAEFKEVFDYEAELSDAGSATDFFFNLARQCIRTCLMKFDPPSGQGPKGIAYGTVNQDMPVGPDQCTSPELEARGATVQDYHRSAVVIHSFNTSFLKSRN